jgi:CheY-like chemotaxis protein
MHHVLVIDDQDLITNLLEQVLTRFGYRVTMASRGHEGLRLYNKGAFDLVITDLIMPDIDGGATLPGLIHRLSVCPERPGFSDRLNSTWFSPSPFP